MSANLPANSLGVVTVALISVEVKTDPDMRNELVAMSSETVREEMPEGITLVTDEGTYSTDGSWSKEGCTYTIIEYASKLYLICNIFVE